MHAHTHTHTHTHMHTRVPGGTLQVVAGDAASLPRHVDMREYDEALRRSWLWDELTQVRVGGERVSQ